jgi:hypothetical protein
MISKFNNCALSADVVLCQMRLYDYDLSIFMLFYDVSDMKVVIFDGLHFDITILRT